tara:strand:+ start:1390 stop:1842 length:453 start_codon:yes stop_codon:yes gene_type:complete
MAFGYVTYKNFAPVNQIASNLTNSEGCGLKLDGEGEVSLATDLTSLPYAIVAVGTDSITPGTYPSAPVAGSLEVIDQLGVAVQVRASDAGAISAGKLVIIDDAASVPGSFKMTNSPADGNYVWGVALTACAANEQFILRFSPYLAVVPAP